MYVYCPFSPHNGITIGNVIIFFHLLMLNLFFLGFIINLLPIYRLSCFVSCSLVISVYFYILVLTL
jgi:hypothetical protein